MRWENLFHDLEAQLESEVDYAQADLARDELRRRRADETLWQALEQQVRALPAGGELEIWTREGQLWITVDNLGRDWMSGEVTRPHAHSGYVVVNSSSIHAVTALVTPIARQPGSESAGISPSGSDVAQRSARRTPAVVTFRIVLRDLARRRKTGLLCAGHFSVRGRIDRVGSDFVEFHGQPERGAGLIPLKSQVFFIRLADISYFRLDD
jgi:hypothetical protein